MFGTITHDQAASSPPSFWSTDTGFPARWLLLDSGRDFDCRGGCGGGIELCSVVVVIVMRRWEGRVVCGGGVEAMGSIEGSQLRQLLLKRRARKPAVKGLGMTPVCTCRKPDGMNGNGNDLVHEGTGFQFGMLLVVHSPGSLTKIDAASGTAGTITGEFHSSVFSTRVNFVLDVANLVAVCTTLLGDHTTCFCHRIHIPFP